MTSVNSVFVDYVLLGTRAVNCKFNDVYDFQGKFENALCSRLYLAILHHWSYLYLMISCSPS